MRVRYTIIHDFPDDFTKDDIAEWLDVEYGDELNDYQIESGQ